MNDTKLAWAAGFIDGEGYIGATKCTHGMSKVRDSFTAVINVGQISEVPVHYLQQILGGSIGKAKDKLGYHWQWRVYGDNAARVAAALLPYLVLKRRQADLLLEFQSTKVVGTGSGKATKDMISDEVYARRVAIHAELKELNKRRGHRDRLNKEAPTAKQGGAIVETAHEQEGAEAAEMTARQLKIVG